ncbi:MAG: prenyltransferase/squalene oxidase repeat-containing protein [Thermoflexales bacterium]
MFQRSFSRAQGLRNGALAILALAALGGSPASARAADPIATTTQRAVAWLSAKQQPDGGFGTGFSAGSDVGATADAVAALAVAGTSVRALKSASGASPLDYLAAKVAAGGLKTGQIAKAVAGLVAAGIDPRAFGGHDLVADLAAGQNPKTGIIGDNIFTHGLAMLAFARAKAPQPAGAAAALIAAQSASGGWAFTGAGAPDVDTTAQAVISLIAAGYPANSGPAGHGLSYLSGLQNVDGGFPYQSPSDYGTDSNTNSTALVILAHIASGDQPESWFRPGGYNALGNLVLAQRPSGAMPYQAAYPDENVLATIGAIPALMRQNLR